MKLHVTGFLSAVALAGVTVVAQPPEEGTQFGPPPFVKVLDTDGDGKISAEEIAKAGESLKTLDKNGDGSLTMEEIAPPRGEGQPRFGERGPRDGEVAKDGALGRPGLAGGRNPMDFWKQLDTDGDGKISQAEAPERMKQNFDRMDANADGLIDETEIKQMFEKMREGFAGGGGKPNGTPGAGPGGFEDRIKQMDTDGDGKVSKTEAPERLQQNFDRIDANADGFIDAAEIKQMMEKARQDGFRPDSAKPKRPESN